MGLFGDADLKQLRTVLGYLSVMLLMRARNAEAHSAIVGSENDGAAAWEESRQEAIVLVNRLVAKGKSAQVVDALGRSGPRKGDEKERAEWSAVVRSIQEQSDLE